MCIRDRIGTVLGLAVTGLTAYGMSFKELPHRKVFMTLILIPMLFNGGLIPYYIQLASLNLVDTFWVDVYKRQGRKCFMGRIIFMRSCWG